MKRERPLIILWLDNLGLFYPLVAELGLTNIAAAFEGGTVVRHLISPVPSVTESAEMVVKTGCGLDQLPVLGEVTFDRATRQYFHLKQTDFDRETGTVTPVEGAPRLADFVSPALAKRLISNLGFTICQIGWKLGQPPLPAPPLGGKEGRRVISLEDDEAIRLEYTASYDIIPLQTQALLRAMQDYEANLYLLNISGDSIVHDEGLAGQATFMKRLDKEFPGLVEGISARAKEPTLIMFSDHGPRPVQGHLKSEEFLAGVEGLIFTGESTPSPLLASGEGRGPGGGVRAANAAVVSNGRGSLYLYVRNPDDKTTWRRTAYRQLRDYHGHDILAAIADQPETAFVVCNREEGGIAILSAEGEATLSAADGGFLYQLAWGQDPLGLGEIEGRVVLAQEMLERTHDKPFPYPLQWLEFLQAPCCGDVMIAVDKYAFFWDKPWIITTHGGPSRTEVGTSLLAVGPQDSEAGIRYGRQIACGSLGQLYNSLCRILYGRPPSQPRPRGLSGTKPEADLLFGPPLPPASGGEDGGVEDNPLKIQFLGTGAAEGIPSFGCACPRCQVARKEGGPNVRQRASVLIEAAGQRLLLDAPPEINSMLNQAEVFDLSAILLSHEHFDHIGGLIAFEYWNRVLPIFAGYDVLPKLQLTPRLEERALLSGFHAHTRLHFGDLSVMPFKVMHHVPCYGFAFEERWTDGSTSSPRRPVACPEPSRRACPEPSRREGAGARVLHFNDSGPELSDLHRHLLEGADVAIFHTPTFESHDSHISVQEIISLVQDYSIPQVIITHINHNNLLHEELVEKTAPHGITVAHDGLTLEV